MPVRPVRLDIKAFLILIAFFVATRLLWNTPIIYPVSLRSSFDIESPIEE